MQTPKNGDKISTKDGWLTCPICKRNHRLLRITDATRARGLPVYCRTCHSEVILDMGYLLNLRTWSEMYDGIPLSVGGRVNGFAPTQELVDDYIMKHP